MVALAVVGAASLLLGGCSQVVSRTVTAAIEAVAEGDSATSTAKSRPAITWENASRYSESLKEVKSGPGIAVFEPVAKVSDSQSVNFGAVCGRWLHLNVGGQGAFGKTPLWGQLEDARAQFKYSSLRLTEAKVRALANSLGLTHVAVGEIELTEKASGCVTACWALETASHWGGRW